MRRLVYAAALALLCTACDSGPADSRVGAAFVEEQAAYHTGVLAYLYGYPMVDMYRRLHNDTQRVGEGQERYFPLNTLVQVDDNTWAAWLDLRDGERSIRLSGSAGQQVQVRSTDFYFNWRERNILLPSGAGKTLRLYSELGDGDGGDEAFNTGTPLAHLVLTSYAPLAQAPVILPADHRGEPAGPMRLPPLDPMRSLGFYEVLNHLLQQLPLPPEDQSLLYEFSANGFGPTAFFSESRLSPARKRGLERAIRDARLMLDNVPAGIPGNPPAPPGIALGRAASYRRFAEEVFFTQETKTEVGSR